MIGINLKNLVQKLGLLEKRCHQCLKPFTAAAPGEMLCPICQKGITPYNGPACALCGVPMAVQIQGKRPICSQCQKDPPPWNDYGYFSLYTGLLRDMLLRLKFDREIHLSRVLGNYLLSACANLSRPDLIVPLPQHPENLAKRGFNQAHELAKSFCSLSGFALSSNILFKVKKNLPQEGLSAAERRVNVANAFTASPHVQGKCVWLIDDIMTTGATSREATLALLHSGASAVNLLFVARTPPSP